MGETVCISFKEEEQDLYEYMEKLHREGDYYNRSHVVKVALEHLRKEKGKEIIV